MTGVKEIDLVSEHEKAKANVAMLDSILAIKKQKDEQQISLSKSQAEVKSLSTNLQATKTDLDNLKASLIKDEEENRAKAEKWRAKNIKIERIVFDPDLQQAVIALFCLDSDLLARKGDKSNEILLDEAYRRGRNDLFNQIAPLAQAGQFIRGCKLEWERNTKDQKLVELGNKASHYGMAWADATLYQSFCPAKRNDPELYISFYGLHPDFVWKNRGCRLLLDVLDWRGDMKDFYPPVSQHRCAYSKTTFSKSCDELIASINAKLNTWTVASLNTYLKDSEKGAQLYKDLKTYHAAGAIMHETYLKNKRVN